MRTVGALRDAQRANRKARRLTIRELVRAGHTLEDANTIAGERYDAEWAMLERQAELNKVPGNRR